MGGSWGEDLPNFILLSLQNEWELGISTDTFCLASNTRPHQLRHKQNLIEKSGCGVAVPAFFNLA